MTQAIWVILGGLAVPVVLLLATTGCTNTYDPFTVPPDDKPPPDGGDGDGDGDGDGGLGPLPPLPTYKDAVLATPGLLGYWRLGEGGSPDPGPAVNSYSPGILDGAYVNLAGITLGVEQSAVPLDLAALFAGTPTGGLVDVAPMSPTTPLVDGGEVTVELWAKLLTPVPDWRLLVGCYEPLPPSFPPPPDTTIAKGYRLRVQTVSGPIEFEASIGGMTIPLTTQIPIDAEWHHVVLTFLNAVDPDPRKLELYIDGDLKANLTTTTGVFDLVTTQSLRFAGGYLAFGTFGDVTDPYPGGLDEVALYLSHLTEDEVVKHYNARNQL